ncbi:MAG: ATP-binding protein, partial [Armatimonadota bacterium]|nr:ATP-binding protein [Armatimonadota bacterium]
MSEQPFIITSEQQTSAIPVRISYRIIELFSEGLYSSPNKAIEELVSNSFDAGANNVHVLLSSDRTTGDAVIVVVDDGAGMNPEELEQHWIIGKSNKRKLKRLPKGRGQIGKFG